MSAADRLDEHLELDAARAAADLHAGPSPFATLAELRDLELDLERHLAAVSEAITADVLEHLDLEPSDPVLAAHAWRTNGELIADVAELYLEPSWRILDPTHGRGIWWKRWAPDPDAGGELVAHDLRVDGVDFRDLPHDADSFDAVAFDPPYVCVGGRKTTGTADLHDRYGLEGAPTSPAELQQLIDDGLAEAVRVVRPGGVVLVKCQDYVSSGKLWPGAHLTLTAALELGLQLVDRLEHIAGVRPQPSNRTRKCPTCKGSGTAADIEGSVVDCDRCTDGRIPTTQQHARRNVSTLFVLRKPKGARRHG